MSSPIVSLFKLKFNQRQIDTTVMRIFLILRLPLLKIFCFLYKNNEKNLAILL